MFFVTLLHGIGHQHPQKEVLNQKKWLFFDINQTSTLFNEENTKVRQSGSKQL